MDPYTQPGLPFIKHNMQQNVNKDVGIPPILSWFNKMQYKLLTLKKPS